MKLNKWIFGALALGMMASCSDNDLGPNMGIENGGSQSSSDVSYLGVSIELPSEPATRGANDVFDDGLPIEYSVDHAAILLFQGNSEADAKFIGAYKLETDQAFDQPNEDQVTVSFQKTIQVLEKPLVNADGSLVRGPLWGLAILNYSENIFELGLDKDDENDENEDNDESGLTYGDLKIKKADGTTTQLIRMSPNGDNATSATTFSVFREYITDSNFIRTEGGYFFMTNAPLSNSPGTSAVPNNPIIRTLAPLAPNFEKTQIAAIQNPSGCIFVERALAKITCSDFPTEVKIPHSIVTIDDAGVPTYTTEDYTLKIAKVEWCLDNEEKTSYIVRNAQAADFWTYAHTTKGKYRFIGNIGMNDTQYDSDEVHDPDKENGERNTKTWYRTYWCTDPNYSTDKEYNRQTDTKDGKTPFKTLLQTLPVAAATPIGNATPLYSRENTFDVPHQQYKNTTRVVFKVQYAGEQLYAIRNNLQTLYLQNDAENLLKRSVLGSTRLHDLIMKYKKDDITSLDYSENDFVINFGPAEPAGAGNTIDPSKADPTKNIDEGDYVITSLSFRNDDKVKFIETNFKPLTNDDRTYINNELKAIAVAANEANHIVPFKDNICYYVVYLKHFGDTYCPLEEGWMGDDVSEVYGQIPEGNTPTPLSPENSAKNYLGRYGLVRNNWYDLQIDDIKRLGNAKIPNGNVDTSDDNKLEEWYLSARIHILSWAKRTQSVTFE